MKTKLKNSFMRIVVMVCFMILSFASYSQQDPMYTQYMFNTLAINPAYAGSRELLSATLLHRSQWVGFEGAPVTQTLTAHTPLKNNKLALGFSITNDKIGPIHEPGFYADVAYRLNFEKSKLSFGIKGGVSLFQADYNSLELINSSDQLFSSDIAGVLLPNVGFGIYYYSDKYYLGFSTPRMLKNEMKNDLTVNTQQTPTQELHYFLTGGYVFNINEDLKFLPSILMKTTVTSPISTDINANFLIFDQFMFGAMYRIGDSFGTILQYQFNDQFKAGYAFDLTTSELGSYNSGTHEIMVSYDFGYNKIKVKSPRYF